MATSEESAELVAMFKRMAEETRHRALVMRSAKKFWGMRCRMYATGMSGISDAKYEMYDALEALWGTDWQEILGPEED